MRLHNKDVSRYPSNFVLCNNNVENSLHVFFKYRRSCCNIWRMCTFSHGVRDVMNGEQAISGIVFQIPQQLTIEDSNLFACVLWSI